MKRLVALLRGINVGGRGIVAMADLRDFLEKQGGTGVRTLLQSGNAVFNIKSATGLEAVLEQKAATRWNHTIEFIIREAAEWQKIVETNPYPREAAEDPARLVVVALREKAAAASVDALRQAIVGPEYFQESGRELYLMYPDGQAHTKLTNALIERKLGLRGTARNWNTVLKIAALLRE